MTNSKKLNNSSEIGIKHRYIDVELLKEQFEKHCEQVGESVDDWGMFYDEFPRMLADIPSADVQPVVHCNECQWHDGEGDQMYCLNDFWNFNFTPNVYDSDFCSHGDKLDGDEND